MCVYETIDSIYLASQVRLVLRKGKENEEFLRRRELGFEAKFKRK